MGFNKYKHIQQPLPENFFIECLYFWLSNISKDMKMDLNFENTVSTDEYFTRKKTKKKQN